MNKITDINEIGEMVRAARKAQGLTQVQLSAACGVGVRFIRELEHGKPSCHIGKALQVMSMLGLDVFIKGRSAS